MIRAGSEPPKLLLPYIYRMGASSPPSRLGCHKHLHESVRQPAGVCLLVLGREGAYSLGTLDCLTEGTHLLCPQTRSSTVGGEGVDGGDCEATAAPYCRLSLCARPPHTGCLIPRPRQPYEANVAPFPLQMKLRGVKELAAGTQPALSKPLLPHTHRSGPFACQHPHSSL